ncbi:hypothetical protein QFC24_003296 [Naganishia onofrii]|uniref:Uncharacterized protein n=1 Tax=Naganishia onofrii TaxID=1851511 RepID=A0ACC2XLK8_9TREE|nr:hypothetical protein QFC24_003296 [Naganishia onofrii]
MTLKLHPKAAITAGLLAAHGLRKGSLSASGSAAALLYKANIKASLEDGHDDQTAAAGKRTAWQVLCNSTPSLISAMMYKFVLTSEASATFVEVCGRWGLKNETIAKALVFTTLGLFGTGMSVVGGCIIGATVSVLQARFGMLHRIGAASFIGTGAVAGFAGSMLDSFLGATLQQTLYDTDKKMILLDDVAARQRKLVGAGSASNRVVSGLEVLSNNQVNFLSSATIAILSGLFGVYVL